MLFLGLGDADEDVVLHQLVHQFVIYLVMDTFSTDSECRRGPVGVGFVLEKPIQAQDNVEPFYLRDGRSMGARQGFYDDVERQRLVGYRECSLICHLDLSDVQGAKS